MNEQASSFFKETKEAVTGYIEAKIKLFKIDTYEKLSRVSAVLYSSILLLLLSFFILFFISLGLGFFLGTLLNSTIFGFLIVSGIYLVILLYAFSRKKSIEKYFADKVIGELFKEDENGK